MEAPTKCTMRKGLFKSIEDAQSKRRAVFVYTPERGTIISFWRGEDVSRMQAVGMQMRRSKDKMKKKIKKKTDRKKKRKKRTT